MDDTGAAQEQATSQLPLGLSDTLRNIHQNVPSPPEAGASASRHVAQENRPVRQNGEGQAQAEDPEMHIGFHDLFSIHQPSTELSPRNEVADTYVKSYLCEQTRDGITFGGRPLELDGSSVKVDFYGERENVSGTLMADGSITWSHGLRSVPNKGKGLRTGIYDVYSGCAASGTSVGSRCVCRTENGDMTYDNKPVSMAGDVITVIRSSLALFNPTEILNGIMDSSACRG